MRAFFVVSSAAQLVIWLLGAYAPSRYYYSSTLRVFIPQLVAATPALLGTVILLLDWPPVYRLSQAPWHPLPGTRGWYNSLNSLTLLLYVAVLLYLGWMADQAYPGGALAFSPCDRSSCSAVAGATEQADGSALVYNPNGAFVVGGREFADGYTTTCIFTDCAYASGNGLGVVGRAPDAPAPGLPGSLPCTAAAACLATDDPALYPDPGVGISGGLLLGLGTLVTGNTAACPGETAAPGRPLAGALGCAYCGPWEAARGLAPLNPGCPAVLPLDAGTSVPASSNDLYCRYLCPPVTETRTRDAAYKTFALAAVAAASFLVKFFVDEGAARVEQWAQLVERRAVLSVLDAEGRQPIVMAVTVAAA